MIKINKHFFQQIIKQFCLMNNKYTNIQNFHLHTPKSLSCRFLSNPNKLSLDCKNTPEYSGSPLLISTPYKTTRHTKMITSRCTSTDNFKIKKKNSLKSVLNLCRRTLKLSPTSAKKTKTLFFQVKQPDYYDNIYKYRTKIFTEKPNIIDNKLNIKYAENELQYMQKLYKEKNKFEHTYRGFHGHLHSLSKTKDKIKFIKDKVSFLKYTVDFAYSDCVITKNKITSSEKGNDENRNNIKTFHDIDKEIKIDKKKLDKYLSSSLSIKKIQVL